MHTLAGFHHKFTIKCSNAMQARLIDSADILVIPHGSTFGNVIFAARKSVIVHISSSEGELMLKQQRVGTQWLLQSWLTKAALSIALLLRGIPWVLKCRPQILE